MTYSIPKVAVGNYANHHGFTDIHPYEIVRIVSRKTIDVRAMKATLVPDWKPEIIPGGFSGRCINQHTQEYTYESDPTFTIVRVRYRKDSNWHSSLGLHFISKTPQKFYDYNF